MTFRNKLLFTLMVLSAIMIYLTYTPSDSRYFWTYWCTMWVLLSFGYMMDVLFASSSAFVFDPNPENWRRRMLNSLAYKSFASLVF